MTTNPKSEKLFTEFLNRYQSNYAANIETGEISADEADGLNDTVNLEMCEEFISYAEGDAQKWENFAQFIQTNPKPAPVAVEWVGPDAVAVFDGNSWGLLDFSTEFARPLGNFKTTNDAARFLSQLQAV